MLSVDKLTIAYGQEVVVNDISFKLKPGQVTAILGANGAGKTSIINSISGVMPIKSGKIIIGDEKVHQLKSTTRSK
ncbi:MAG: ABC transporter ATP-binding protein, partial [Chloroflexota bacterium]